MSFSDEALSRRRRLGRHSQGGAPHSRGAVVPHLGGRGWRAGARGLPRRHAGRRSPRLEHAGHGRLRVPAGAAPAADRQCPQGGVLHDRERRRLHRPRDACRRRRVHHEALRQGDHDGEVPGSRAGLGARAERAATFRSKNQAGSMTPAVAPPRPSAPANRIRVLVADDSVVVRGLIARWLQESGIEVVATVPNGRLAIAALDRVAPDIVLLDLDMPELDGISALPRLLEKQPGLSVIVVSTLTQRNAAISLKCLSLGALDYLPKPATNREVTTSLGFRQELVAKVEGLARPRRAAASAETEPRRPAGAAPRPRVPVAPRCLLIGASTGGPRAIAEVLAGLNGVLRQVPTLVVQHMPPIFTTVFAEHLQGQLGVPAREALDGEAPVADRSTSRRADATSGLSATSSTRSCSASTTRRRSISAARQSTSCSATPPRSSEPRRSRWC